MEELGTKALSILVDNLQKGAELMPAYVQDLFERYVQFKVYWDLFWMWLCVIVLIICLTAIINWTKEDDEWKAALWYFWFILTLVVVWCIAYSLFQIHFVPELYMIDDLMSYWCHCK